MLHHRLVYGFFMTLIFLALMGVDGWLDGSLGATFAHQPIRAPILTLVAAILMIPAHLELARILKQKGFYVYTVITLPVCIFTATFFFWRQFHLNDKTAIAWVIVLILTIFWIQFRRFGIPGTIGNTAASVFTIFYLGVFCSFILAIRIQFGWLTFLLFIFTIKCSDIGAYVIGTYFGKRKLCPSISAGKTWEGLGGAMLASAVFSLLFCLIFDIIPIRYAVVFGAAFGLLGQLSDLVESMLKRDAAVKDSSHSIPGFGGILDVIDSLLATAPIGYLVFDVLF